MESPKKDLTLKEKYAAIRNKVTLETRKAYNQYYQKKFEENSNNMRKTWALTNELMGRN